MAKKTDPAGYIADYNKKIVADQKGQPDPSQAQPAVATSATKQGFGAGVTYDPTQLIKTYLPGASDQVVAALVATLKGSEALHGGDYHAALNALVQQYPDLQKFTPLGQAGIGTSPSGGAPDPLAFQAFFAQSVAPYLNQVADQTQSMEAPLYQQLQQQIGSMKGNVGNYKDVLSAYLPVMQAGEQNTLGALRGAAAAAPGLTSIVNNAQMAQAAALKSYYESIAARSAGTAGAGAPPVVQPTTKTSG